MMGSIGVACLGSTERALGLAARTAGLIDDAVAHLERAVGENQRLGNRPMTAIARADLAQTLLVRNRFGDRDEATVLVSRAIDDATRMGMVDRVRRWTSLREEITSPSAVAPAASCVRQGTAWEIVSGAERVYVRHSVGMGYLATLLASPHQEFSAGELAGLRIVSQSQEILDASALSALRRRMEELEDELDSATLAGHADRAARLQAELDELAPHARAAAGLAGRSRVFGDSTERARTSVQKAIRRAISSIGQDAPRLAERLQVSVQTGYSCRYEPRSGAPDRWTVRTR
jgi:hypothetical protein